jgi:hypothetical protein
MCWNGHLWVFGINTHSVEVEYDDMLFFEMLNEGMQVRQLDTAARKVGTLRICFFL